MNVMENVYVSIWSPGRWETLIDFLRKMLHLILPKEQLAKLNGFHIDPREAG